MQAAHAGSSRAGPRLRSGRSACGGFRAAREVAGPAGERRIPGHPDELVGLAGIGYPGVMNSRPERDAAGTIRAHEGLAVASLRS